MNGLPGISCPKTLEKNNTDVSTKGNFSSEKKLDTETSFDENPDISKDNYDPDDQVTWNRELSNRNVDLQKVSNDVQDPDESIVWDNVDEESESLQDITKSNSEMKKSPIDKSDGDSSNSLDNTDVAKKPRTPENNGVWDGVRGDSTWKPDKEYIPPEKSRNSDHPYSNPDQKSWDELLKKYNISGIKFKNGFPDFSEVSKGTVKIENFEKGKTAAKVRNFIKADRKLAEIKGCSPEKVTKWREENNYTWHECEDKVTMQKVPNEIHANIPHDGGRSQ